MKEETKEKIAQLQNLEQNINSLIAQKHQFQSQNIEVDNSLTQLETTEKVFSIIGNIMVASKKSEIKKRDNRKIKRNMIHFGFEALILTYRNIVSRN